MSCRSASLGLACAIAAFAAAAQDNNPAPEEGKADFRSKVEEYRFAGSELRKPAGEITVFADRIEWQQLGITRGTGNVRLSSDTMEIRGDVAELKQYDDGRLSQAHVTGDPVQLTDAATETSPEITARAKKADYDASTNIVELAGNAVLTRGSDRITGENIRYDVGQRRVQASGGDSGQVKIVIKPAAPKPKTVPPAETPAVPQEPKP